MLGEKKKPLYYFSLILLVTLSLKTVNGGVLANFTVVYDFVASDEIVLLQNAIEDIGYISSMPVRPVALESSDVPDRPLNVTAEAISSTEMKVSWAPVVFNMGNLSVVGYTVFYKKYIDDPDQWNRLATLAPNTELVLPNLSPYTTYTIRALAFHQMGNGIASFYVDEKTFEGVPEEAPRNFKCVSENPYSITLSWDLLESTKWNGLQNDYTLNYRLYNSGGNLTTVKYNSGARSGEVPDLKPYTKYELYLMATTRIGPGPRTWCVTDTMEGVPSQGPRIIFWELDPRSPLEIIIRWEPLDEQYVNGRLTGYEFCWGVSKDGKMELEYPEMECEKFDQYTTQHVLKYQDKEHTKKLEPYMQIKAYISGTTQVGTGAHGPTEYFDTCTCPISIYAAWFSNPPYVSQASKTSNVQGIFPDYLTGMIDQICGTCPGLKRANTSVKPSKLYWDRSKDGHNPLRNDEKDLKERVSHNTHLHVAMFGRTEIENFQSDYKFVSIIQSPGSAFVIRDPEAELDKTAAIMESLAKCWPAIIIIVVLSTVAGTFVWTADCEYNQDEFPNESFIKGIYHGSYWAFVSMTTVGYGDKTPRSCMAQIIAIVWMLMGPIINGIVIGTITTSLTTIQLETDPKIYGNRVEAMQNSFEYNLAVRRNADIGISGKNYSDYDDLLDDLANREIEGILIDSLVAADKFDKMGEKHLKLSKIIPESSGWGIILSSDFIKLEDDIRSYVKAKEDEMKAMVLNRTQGKLTIKAKAPSDLDTGIIDPKAQTFKDFVYYGLATYVILSILGLAFEFGYLRFRNRKIKPYGQAHRELLETELSDMMQEFCLKTMELLKEKSEEHESELKRFFWKKGYSFGIDAWFKEKVVNEDQLKKGIRYNEIMEKDLYQGSDSDLQKKITSWQKGKRIVSNVVRVMPKKQKYEDNES